MQSAKSINSQLFLSKNGHTVHASGLSQLVSFFLTLKEGDSFLYIVEGADAESAMNVITKDTAF